MCNEPVIRTPANGLAFAYFARIAIRPGISCSAISISFRPNSARPRSATLWSTAVLVVTLLMYFELGQVLIESFGSIYLRGIFTGKRSASVAAHSTIGVDDDLSSGQARITFRATNYKSAGRIDEISRFGVNPFRRHNLPNHSFNDSLANFFMFYFGSVLGRDDYCIDTYWTKSTVFYCYLGFSFRPN